MKYQCILHATCLGARGGRWGGLIIGVICDKKFEKKLLFLALIRYLLSF